MIDHYAPAKHAHFFVAIDGSNAVVVAAAGEIDMASGPAFVECMAAAIAQSDAVIVDLRAVDFMDSTGLNALIHGRAQAIEKGAMFWLRGVTAGVHRLLDLCGLEETFDILD